MRLGGALQGFKGQGWGKKFSLSCRAGWKWGKKTLYKMGAKIPSFGPTPPHCHSYCQLQHYHYVWHGRKRRHTDSKLKLWSRLLCGWSETRWSSSEVLEHYFWISLKHDILKSNFNGKSYRSSPSHSLDHPLIEAEGPVLLVQLWPSLSSFALPLPNLHNLCHKRLLYHSLT